MDMNTKQVDNRLYQTKLSLHFVFGQDWMCPVDFAESSIAPTEYPTLIASVEADAKLVAEIAEELRPYFESYTTAPVERNKSSVEYLAKCRQLLEQVDRTFVLSISPMELTVIDSDQIPVFDTSIPMVCNCSLSACIAAQQTAITRKSALPIWNRHWC